MSVANKQIKPAILEQLLCYETWNKLNSILMFSWRHLRWFVTLSLWQSVDRHMTACHHSSGASQTMHQPYVTEDNRISGSSNQFSTSGRLC